MSQSARMKTMAILLAILVLCMLFGCTEDRYLPVSAYECTTLEMQKVEVETRFCSKEGAFQPNWCYTAAISRNCQPKKAPGK